MVSVVALGAGLLVAFRLTADGPDGSAGPRVVQPGAPGQPGRTLSTDDLSSLSPPAHTAADTRFMQRMIMHHGQALRMTALVPGRGQSAEIPLLAGRIDASQRDEITQMRRWLADRREEVAQPTPDHAGHELMPGMLTDGQFRQLDLARGVAFDRLFLEFMIYHHEGALAMVRELYATGGGFEPACDRFARDVNADQNIEIGRMRLMLAGRSS